MNCPFGIYNNDYTQYHDILAQTITDKTSNDDLISINKLKKILLDIISDDAKKYKPSYLINFIDAFDSIFIPEICYEKLNIDILDKRPYDNTNNESVFILDIACFKFVLKILSDDKNGLGTSKIEIDYSKFINKNFILNNVCPHFCLYVKSFDIGHKFAEYRFRNNINYCLVYHYIEPYIHKNIKFRDFNTLLEHINNRTLFTQSESDDILYNIFFQIIYSLCGLSKYEINHNDLRSVNIMLQNDSHNIGTYTHYQIKKSDITYNYFVPNMGFRVKIIDFGLSNTKKIDSLKTNIFDDYHMFNHSGIGPLYSPYYDIHYIINEIFNEYNIQQNNPLIAELLYKIINKKYIGTHKSNKFINKYWRLAFPWKISSFLKYYSINKTLFYNNGKLVITTELLNLIIDHIKLLSRGYFTASTFNSIIDPIDNNCMNLKTPFEAIHFFDKYTKYDDDIISKISDLYVLDFDSDLIV